MSDSMQFEKTVRREKGGRVGTENGFQRRNVCAGNGSNSPPIKNRTSTKFKGKNKREGGNRGKDVRRNGENWFKGVRWKNVVDKVEWKDNKELGSNLTEKEARGVSHLHSGRKGIPSEPLKDVTVSTGKGVR